MRVLSAVRWHSVQCKGANYKGLQEWEERLVQADATALLCVLIPALVGAFSTPLKFGTCTTGVGSQPLTHPSRYSGALDSRYDVAAATSACQSVRRHTLPGVSSIQPSKKGQTSCMRHPTARRVENSLAQASCRRFLLVSDKIRPAG